MSSTLLDKRRLKDRNRNFNPRWEEEFAFINFAGRPLCLICNVALTHFKSCNLKRHYETHHKSFAIEYPPWSERRRKRLLALKISRTHQEVPLATFDEETRLATEAGFVISQACAQNSRLLAEGESCKQLVLDVVSILDPLNARLRQLIDDIPLVRSSWLKSDGAEMSSDAIMEDSAAVSDLQAASDDSGPNSPRPSQQVESQPPRCASQHVHDIEHAFGCFICSACPVDPAHKTPFFSSSDPASFQSHWSNHHSRLSSLVCVYCNSRVQSDQFVTHVTAHLLPITTTPSAADIFVCPAEPDCPAHFSSAHSAPLRVHWATQHSAVETDTPPQLNCPHCKRGPFTSLDDWIEHIQQYARPLVHCGVSGCLVKSPSRSLVIEHIARKHSDPVELTPGSKNSALIHETFEMLCSKPELLPTPPESKTIDEPEAKLPQCSVPSNGSPNQTEPRFVFLLRCPHCALNTVRWQHFLLHAPTCPGATKAGLTSYRCRIYWCSDCQAVSTEQSLVSEHVMHTHRSRAFVVREQIRVAMLDARAKPISCKPPNSGTASVGQSVSTQSTLINNTPLLTAASNTFNFTSHAVAPTQMSFTSTQAPPTSNALSSTMSEDVLGESIMNLAALARPSRQQTVTLSSQTHLTAALPQALPAIPLTPSSITAISLMPSAQVNVSAGAPVSLFPSAVALKTLQELTGSGANNVNSMSASDAASAVAAMAAAALTGLTGFDVSAPSIASVQSQAFPVTLTGIPSSLGLNSPKVMPAVATLVSPAQPTAVTSNGTPSSTTSLANLTMASTATTTTDTTNAFVVTTSTPTASNRCHSTPAGTKITSSTNLVTSPNHIVTTSTGSSIARAPNVLPLPPHAPSASTNAEQLPNEAMESMVEDQVDGDDERDYPDFTGRVGDDMVSFPFDEDKFRAELSTHIRSPVLDRLVGKMRQFSSYLVRILGKENHRRIPVCPECGKVFPYGLGDFKRHLLTVHLEVPREYLKECLRFTYLPKSEEKFQEVQEQLAMRQMRPRMLEAGRRRVPLPYSIAILRRLTVQLPSATRDFLEQKMQLYSRLSVIVDTRGGFRRYKCNHCSYSSPHALADVRKHILGSHCGISTKHFRHCLQASRLDPVEFTLFSDDKLARLAKEFFNRRQGSEAGKLDSSRSPSPAGSCEQNGAANELSSSLSSTSTPSIMETRSHDTFVSRFTAMVPGSKTPVTVRIRPPVPPDASSAANDSSLAVGSSSSLGSPVAGQSNNATNSAVTDRCSPAQPFPTPQSPLESPESEDEFQTTMSVDHLDLAALPSIPELEGADHVVELPLPYSETVLRKLLDSAGATEIQTKDILNKMQIYSTYTMTRICRGDRTLAFRCRCGRLFVTTRQSDSGIRAATLADSRRHVMGVHARISHEFITICCQASRITRDYDFELYSDEMLLRLAMERPIKLNATPAATSGNANTSLPSNSTPTSTTTSVTAHSGTSKGHKPLKELAPYPPILPNLGNSTRKSVPADASIESGLSTDTRDSAHTPNSATPRDRSNDDSLDDRDASDPESSGARKSQKGLEDPLSHLTKAQASTSEEVERVINLPYSSEALYSLVQGYCPASYFPVLEEKMDVYSSLKVFITRRRGRRYFCCSGCSSSSPHGMGDIRKHILGVHAKVPERYKAAAMHCSRLSREDNTLLPNHVLLHLAKMKWKGTVIKPLAEMDLSQFGTRRASAVGLTRPSGQFASQVYQPSTQHRETEKLTALPATAPLATTGNKFHAVGNKSANAVPDSNGSPLLDELSSSSLFHMDDSVTAGDTGDLSALDEPYVIRISMDQCDPSQDTDYSEFEHLYVCSLCQYASGYVGATRAHVVLVHHVSSVPAYQCPHCEFTYSTRKEAVAHHESEHEQLEFQVGRHLPAHRAAMLRVRIRDVDQEPAVVAASLKTLVREGKLRPHSHHHPPEHQLGDSSGLDLPEPIDFFEDELDEDEEDFPADDVNSSVVVTDRSDCEPRPSKIARLDEDHRTRKSITDNNRSLSNGENDRSREADHSEHNGENVSVGSTTTPRVTLSGSSRRKPSKSHLVQFKPASVPIGERDVGDLSTSVAPSTPSQRPRSRSPSPDPLSDKLTMDIGEAS